MIKNLHHCGKLLYMAKISTHKKISNLINKYILHMQTELALLFAHTSGCEKSVFPVTILGVNISIAHILGFFSPFWKYPFVIFFFEHVVDEFWKTNPRLVLQETPPPRSLGSSVHYDGIFIHCDGISVHYEGIIGHYDGITMQYHV